jgi:hypothetical protein
VYRQSRPTYYQRSAANGIDCTSRLQCRIIPVLVFRYATDEGVRMRDSWGWGLGGVRAMRVRILPLQIGDILGWYRNVVMPARISSVQSRGSRVEIRESCQQLRVSFKQHPLLHSSIRITLDHDLYSSREVRLLYSPHPPKTRHFSTPLTPTTHTAHRLQISSFSTPIGPDNALAILHASRALAVQGPLGAVGPA